MTSIVNYQKAIRNFTYDMFADMSIDPVKLVRENSSTYKPVEGTPYIKMHFLQNAVDDMTLSDDVTNTTSIFQLTLFYPDKENDAPINEMIDNLMKRFKRLTELRTEDSVIRFISTPEASGSNSVDGWFIKAVSIYFSVSELK